MTTIQQRRAAGLCTVCGETPTSNWVCFTCAQKRKSVDVKRAQERIAGRLCIRCGAPLDAKNTTKKCESCLQKESEWKKRYRSLRNVSICRDCAGAAQGRVVCAKCQEKRSGAQGRRYAKRKAACLCIRCGKTTPMEGSVQCSTCLERQREGSPAIRQRNYIRTKERVFAHYGQSCNCCGESNLGFLTIDHVDSSGAVHRKSLTCTLYHWLAKQNFPNGFQTLCYNCNLGRARNRGVCPHLTQP